VCQTWVVLVVPSTQQLVLLALQLKRLSSALTRVCDSEQRSLIEEAALLAEQMLLDERTAVVLLQGMWEKPRPEGQASAGRSEEMAM